MEVSLSSILLSFNEQTEKPVNFLDIHEDLSNTLKSNLKDLYDYTKSEEGQCSLKLRGNALKKLIINKFDLEQIWQQIELQNEDVLNNMIKDLSNYLVVKNNLIFNSLQDDLVPQDNESVEVTQEESSKSDSDNDSVTNFTKTNAHQFDGDESSEDKEEYVNTEPFDENTTKQQGSIVDDAFFNLKEMESFLEKEENPKVNKTSDSDDEESIDFFEKDSDNSEDEAKTARFKDYFITQDEGKPRRKVNKLMEELDQENSDTEPEDEDKLENELKSTLELRQERLKQKIEQLEDEAISDKPWQLKGEITAESRPQNSLLEEIVEFDLTTRPAPVITEQTSLQLEDIIRQRIKHKTFDSVEKKNRPVDTPIEYKKKLVLDQEKSKESLSKIYEKEYLEQQAELEKDKMDVEEEEPEAHKKVKNLMKNLFAKLDALSNFHFTPMPAIPELKIISNLPAVHMEEVAPVATSDAALLAPEEVKNKLKGDLIGKGEKTSTDKKRERRKKKLKQKIHSKQKAKMQNSISKKKHIKV